VSTRIVKLLFQSHRVVELPPILFKGLTLVRRATGHEVLSHSRPVVIARVEAVWCLDLRV
jgi:hypothetical protein